MLTDRCQHLTRSYFYKLCLMNATVNPAAMNGIVGIIAHGIHVKFAKTLPSLSIIIRNRHVSHITIGEHIIPNTVRTLLFGKRSRIAPEKQQSSVGQPP